jgi:hypothetical protein
VLTTAPSPLHASLNPSSALRLDTSPTICLAVDAQRHSTTAFLHRRIINRFPITSNFLVKSLRLFRVPTARLGFETRPPRFVLKQLLVVTVARA